jgi:hypothetical protein
MALKKIKKISLRLLYSAMFHIGVNYLGFQISTNTDKRPYKIARKLRNLNDYIQLMI